MKTVPSKGRIDMTNHFKARNVRDVLQDWHHIHYDELLEARAVILRGMWPPINAMDESLMLLQGCVILSLSKNMIEKISDLAGLENLKVLSLAQNNIKSLNGLEEVGATLEVLIIARNFINQTKGIENLFKLKELDISYNYINDTNEFCRIGSCRDLKSLAFKENPLAKKYPDNIWREEALKLLPELDILDYIKVEDHERCINSTISEIFNLKGNKIINSPQYMIYNDMFKEAIDEVMKLKQTKNVTEERVYSPDNSISI